MTAVSEAVTLIIMNLLKGCPSDINGEKYNKVFSFLTEGVNLTDCFGNNTQAIVSYVLNSAKNECINDGKMPSDTKILAYLTSDFCIEKAYECCLSLENSHEDTEDLKR